MILDGTPFRAAGLAHWTNLRVGRVAKNPFAVRDRERLDPRVRTERAQHPPDVVAHGVDAEVELRGDLRGGVAVREQVEDLVLARREVRVRVG